MRKYLNNSNKRYIKNKRAQEEIVGFALIIIIVAVVLLFLLSFSLKRPEKESIESYEADSFLQSALQVTTSCEINLQNQSVQDLIFSCDDFEFCDNGSNSCEVLNASLGEVLDASWPVGSNKPIKGYEFLIKTGGSELLAINNGNVTNNYKGALQDLPGEIKITFKVYY